MAFAAVCSVAQILDQALQHQQFIFENRQEVESLFKEVSSLQTILENSSQKTSGNITCFELESQIMSAAHRARGLIETHIAEQIIHSNNLVFSSHALFDEAKREIDFIDQQLMKIEEDGDQSVTTDWMETKGDGPDSSTIHDLVKEARDITITMTKVACSIMCITWMAGTGKTTLARLVYDNWQFVDVIRIWVNASQSTDGRQILIEILHSLGNYAQDMLRQKTTQQLQQYFHQSVKLKDKGFFIVLDDLCNTQVLDDLRGILRAGRRILVTSRIENMSSYYCHHMTIFKQIERCQWVIQRSGQQAEFLLKKVSLLHGVILKSSSGVRKTLENQIKNEERKTWEKKIINAERKVKDFIKSCITEYNLKFSPECLMEVIGEIDLVKQLVIKLDREAQRDLQSSLGTASSSLFAPTVNISTEEFSEIKNKLAEQSSKLEIVSLVGMGGIGKTTLARQVYNDEFFVQSFPIRAWVTVSQSYDLEQVLRGLLLSMNIRDRSWNPNLSPSECLYQSLKGWKYLIVIDNIWDIHVWDDLRQIFPDDKCSSRILFTTRLDKVANHAESYLHRVRFLNESEGWDLFHKKVFGEDSCPPQLEKIGKNIVQICGGLPLAIIVIGGLLSKATGTPDHWRSIAKNLTSMILSNEDDRCSKILSLSYTHLPDHLKHCFLYTRIFLEDRDIPVSKVTKLWVAEGFFETLESNTPMEDKAYESLLDLVSRNLILVGKQSSMGKIKTCKIHDVVREFCTREAKYKMFLHISDINLYGIPASASVPLRIGIHPNKRNNIFPCNEKKLTSLEVGTLHIVDQDFLGSLHHLNPEPLRVFDAEMQPYDKGINQGALNELLSYKLRYMSCGVERECKISITFAFPYLQTFILQRDYVKRKVEIWNMPQLRHVKVWELYLPDPLEHENSGIVLQNLQTLSYVNDFRWSEGVARRFPNLRRLGICYTGSELQDYCLENLVFLHTMEALTCHLLHRCPSLLHFLMFPPSLKKLTLERCFLPWKDMVIIASSLPNLEVLKLKDHSFDGKEWEASTEEEFPKMKYLLLENLRLELWRTDSVNFPSLQRLIIKHCRKLKEIPRSIGEIPTLQSIELAYCTESLGDLAKEMQEEQLEYGNDGLEVRIIHW